MEYFELHFVVYLLGFTIHCCESRLVHILDFSREQRIVADPGPKKAVLRKRADAVGGRGSSLRKGEENLDPKAVCWQLLKQWGAESQKNMAMESALLFRNFTFEACFFVVA